jgi:hypothetical protein
LPLGRRIGAAAGLCDAEDAHAIPFNNDFGDAAGELVESKWRFLISMFSSTTAVDVVNLLSVMCKVVDGVEQLEI